MSWFRRTARRVKKSRGYASQSRTVDDAVTSHLTQFARSRRGVEAFIEPKTAVTQTTLLLVASTASGPVESCRRRNGRMPSPSTCRSLVTTRQSSDTRSGCATTTPETRSIPICAETGGLHSAADEPIHIRSRLRMTNV